MRLIKPIICLICWFTPSLVISQTNLGGIHSKRSADLLIISQNISLSPEQVKINYTYKNLANREIHETFVFALPSKTEENLKQFSIKINQQPHTYKIMQRAISASGQDISVQLKALGLPYNPVSAMQALDASENRASITNKLHALHLIDKREEVPTWIVKTYYYCEYTFAPNSITDIEQTYKPCASSNIIKTSAFISLLKLPFRLAKQAINLAIPWMEDNTAANTLQGQFEKYYPQINNYCPTLTDYKALALNYKNSNTNTSQLELKTIHFSLDTDDVWASAIDKFSLKIESPDNYYPILCWNDQFKRKPNSNIEFSSDNYVPLQDIKVLFIEKY